MNVMLMNSAVLLIMYSGVDCEFDPETEKLVIVPTKDYAGEFGDSDKGCRIKI